MAQIEFREIPPAKGGDPEQDEFEFFCEAFFRELGFKILIGATRGPDDGVDLLIEEHPKSVLDTTFRWLVSCKHFAHSKRRRSVSVTDEIDPVGRVLQHGADGFIGFYSTQPSGALQRKLKGLKENRSLVYRFLHGGQLEFLLLSEPNLSDVFRHYFPESFENISTPTSLRSFTSGEINALAPLFLLGSWDANNDGDLAVVEELSKASADEYEDKITVWLRDQTAPVDRDGSIIVFSDRAAWWDEIIPRISPTRIKRFLTTVPKLLGAESEQSETPELLRAPHFSQQLLAGIVETVALLATRAGTELEEDSFVIFLRQLLPEGDHAQWARLSHQLGTLAEVAPAAFCRQVELGLAQEDGVLRLFEPRDAWGRWNGTYLMWALERLAWSENRLPEVVRILARMAAELEPTNRTPTPTTDLVSLLHGVLPQSNAEPLERIQLLGIVDNVSAELGWRTRLDLLPKPGVLHESERPRFRDWTTPERGVEASVDEQTIFFEALAEEIINQVYDAPHRLPDLLKSYGGAGQVVVPKLVALLDDVEFQERIAGIEKGERDELLWEIRSHLNWIARFKSADAPVFERLLGLYGKFEPQDLETRLSWAFHTTLNDPNGDLDDHVAESERLASHRNELLTEGRAREDWYELIIETIEGCEQPATLGDLIAAHEEFSDDSFDQLPADSDRRRDFFRGYFWRRVHERGPAEAKSLYSQLGDGERDKIFALLRTLPISGSTIEFVDTLPVDHQRLYWSEVPIFSDSAADPETVMRAVDELVAVDRWKTALNLTGFSLTEDAESWVPCVRRVLTTGRLRESSDHGTISYIVGKLHDWLLLHDPERDAVIEIEWRNYPFFRRGAAVALLEQLEKDPELFAQFVEQMYRPDGWNPEDGEELDADDPKRFAARQAHQILFWDWRGYPGRSEDGGLDQAALREWVVGATRETKRRKRAVMGRHEIGRALGRTPPVDGLWPCATIREFLEAAKDERMRVGMSTGRFNMEQTTVRPVGDGSPEREQAEQFRLWREELPVSFVETRKLLEGLADSYERQAEWHETRGSA